jgi:hypothetical protein
LRVLGGGNFGITGGDDSGTLQIQPDERRVRKAYPLVGAVATYR